jgi:hypothetical protein
MPGGRSLLEIAGPLKAGIPAGGRDHQSMMIIIKIGGRRSPDTPE